MNQFLYAKKLWWIIPLGGFSPLWQYWAVSWSYLTNSIATGGLDIYFVALYFYNNKLSHYEGGQWNFGEICYLKVYFCQLEDKGHVNWLIWGRPNLHMHLGKLSHYELFCLTSNLCAHWIWCSVQRRFKCYFCSQSGSLTALYCNLHKDLASIT